MISGTVPSSMSRQELLRGIQMASFAVKEAQLFLDTHPTDQLAIAYFNKYNEKQQQLTQEYSRRFGPLNVESYLVPAEETWQWLKGPWPWELEA